MRVLNSALIAAVLVMPVVASGPALAARHCECTDFNLASGICLEYGNCKELPQSVPVVPVRSATDCQPQYRALLCDDKSCKLVCQPDGKQQ
jgi:hypothetical protein